MKSSQDGTEEIPLEVFVVVVATDVPVAAVVPEVPVTPVEPLDPELPVEPVLPVDSEPPVELELVSAGRLAIRRIGI